jgi:hypothetical protein
MKIFQTIEMVENIEKCETCGVTLEPSFAHIPPLLYEGFLKRFVCVAPPRASLFSEKRRSDADKLPDSRSRTRA